MVVEGLYHTTDVPFRLIYADIASPPPVERFLAECAREREDFTHLRFDGFVSRQTARRAALELVDTPFVALVDNNMLCEPGWLSRLVDAAREANADLVSPTIVVRGGSVHYSGGRVLRQRRLRTLGREFTYRPQDTGAPVRSSLDEVSLSPMDIDFVESHCCLARSEALRLPGVLEPAMHSAHTMCYAGFKLKRDYGRRVMFEPSAVASIVPIGFGYDLPWMCLEYMRWDRLEESYRHLAGLLGPGPSTDPSVCFHWHAKHFKYLLLGMLETGRLESTELLSPGDVPETIPGYDDPLPADADQRIRAEVVPFLRERYPECLDPARQWLDFRRSRLRAYLKRMAG